MNKRKKSILSLFLAALLLVSWLPAPPARATAADPILRIGLYYRLRKRLPVGVFFRGSIRLPAGDLHSGDHRGQGQAAVYQWKKGLL